MELSAFATVERRRDIGDRRRKNIARTVNRRRTTMDRREKEDKGGAAERKKPTEKWRLREKREARDP